MTSQQERERIGQMIKVERGKFGWTQAELARRIGVPRPHIAFLEFAKISIGITVYTRLQAVLDLPSPDTVGIVPRQTHILDDHRDAVIAALTGGKSVRRVGRTYGVSADVTTRWAQQTGLVARPGGHSGWEHEA